MISDSEQLLVYPFKLNIVFTTNLLICLKIVNQVFYKKMTIQVPPNLNMYM